MKCEGKRGSGSQSVFAWGCGVRGLVVLVLAGAAMAQEKAIPFTAQPQADARLLQAAQQGSLSALEAAIAAGANVNCRGTNGLCPLLQTLAGAPRPLEAGRRQCLSFLLKAGAKVDAQDGDGRTALIYATRAGDIETVRVVVEAGAYIKWRDRFHKTAVLYAAETGHRDILIYLGQTLKVQGKQSAW